MPPDLTLTIKLQDLPLYTTLLQAGIEIKINKGETMAHLLDRLPGFTADYISDVVQTIFLNGTAVDDLSTPFKGKNPVLALSAAMPGLAGAIFRRNSFHAALRTSTDLPKGDTKENEPVIVTLKLFNSIALEKGPKLLETGVYIKTQRFIDFLAKRADLNGRIQQIYLSNIPVRKVSLAAVLADTEKIHLIIDTKISN